VLKAANTQALRHVPAAEIPEPIALGSRLPKNRQSYHLVISPEQAHRRGQ
jgi:hypothetical protein